MNSPRGHCIRSLINLTLRSCRISDKYNDNNHSSVWTQFQRYYDKYLDPSYSELSEYEFVTLVTMHLPNFLYMSKEWVLENISKMFDQNNYLKWLCAMQGYAYVGTLYQGIYNYLKKHGNLLKSLDDKNIAGEVEKA